ncbi:hypothetical protein [Serratia marcescens]|uniref:hypothetical protein n=1 Tax=Serratia marcescens TaxID=615 RepID=UPI003F50FF82
MGINYAIYGMIHAPNSENALVLRDMPGVAQTYLTHWQSRWDIGKEWRSSY